MSNKRIQISEIKLMDLVKQVWDEMHSVPDPPYVVQRMQNPSPQQIHLPLNIQTGEKRKGFKKKVKTQQQTFDFLKNPAQMPKYISKKDWKLGFDLTKPPFYTDVKKWYADNAKEKKIKTWLDFYIGEDLTMYGFPYKPESEIPYDAGYNPEIMNAWNKAKAFQVYYEIKIANYLQQKQQQQKQQQNQPNNSNN